MSESDTVNPSKREREESKSPDTPTNLPRKKKTMESPQPDDSFASMFKALNDNFNAMRADVNNQFEVLSNKIDNEFVIWQREKAELIGKQVELESRLDRLERQEKKNNIIITGMTPVEPANARAAVDDLFTKQMGLSVTVIDAFQIKLKSGQAKFVARMRSWDDKMSVMKAKGTLKNDVYIADDLIKKDQFVQFKAREFAKSMRKDGKQAKIGAGKVYVNGTAYLWDDKGQSFMSRKN